MNTQHTFSVHCVWLNDVFTSQKDRSPPNPVWEWSKKHISNQHTSKKQRTSQVDFIGLMFNEVPLKKRTSEWGCIYVIRALSKQAIRKGKLLGLPKAELGRQKKLIIYLCNYGAGILCEWYLAAALYFCTCTCILQSFCSVTGCCSNQNY